jgi:predicted exporter
VGGALFILPLYLGPKRMHSVFPKLGKWPRRRALMVAVLFAMALLSALPAALRVRFDSDVRRLDGTDQAILEREERFQQTWGGGETGQAIAAVTHTDYEQALELNDRIYEAAAERIGEENVSSLSHIWKSSKHRKNNSNRWKNFWSAERVGGLKKLIKEKGAQFGFAADAFAPFFQSLENPVVYGDEPANNMIFSQVKGRFIQQKNGMTQALTFFPDKKEFVQAMAGLKEEIPELVLISRNALSMTLARDYTTEFIRISLIALALVLLVSATLLRNLRTMLIVLAPAGAGVLSVLALVSAVGSALNVMNLISGIIVIGLCIDYGVFYVHSYMHSLNLGTRTAITLSAGTTLIGAGALLFAKHPALFSVGLTLVGGISAGYLVSLLVVPALCSLFIGERS